MYNRWMMASLGSIGLGKLLLRDMRIAMGVGVDGWMDGSKHV